MSLDTYSVVNKEPENTSSGIDRILLKDKSLQQKNIISVYRVFIV